jgi:hypothetical protein
MGIVITEKSAFATSDTNELPLLHHGSITTRNLETLIQLLQDMLFPEAFIEGVCDSIWIW